MKYILGMTRKVLTKFPKQSQRGRRCTYHAARCISYTCYCARRILPTNVIAKISASFPISVLTCIMYKYRFSLPLSPFVRVNARDANRFIFIWPCFGFWMERGIYWFNNDVCVCVYAKTFFKQNQKFRALCQMIDNWTQIVFKRAFKTWKKIDLKMFFLRKLYLSTL